LAENDKQEQKQLPRGSNEKNNAPVDYFCKELNDIFYISSVKKCDFNNYSFSLLAVTAGSIFHPPKA